MTYHPSGEITVCPKCFDPDRGGAVCVIICDGDRSNARGEICGTPVDELLPLFSDARFLARWEVMVNRGIDARST